jgi:hypothetical protein
MLAEEIQLGKRKRGRHTRVLSAYVRPSSLEFSTTSTCSTWRVRTVPVINGLSDGEHRQAGDIMTIFSTSHLKGCGWRTSATATGGVFAALAASHFGIH